MVWLFDIRNLKAAEVIKLWEQMIDVGLDSSIILPSIPPVLAMRALLVQNEPSKDTIEAVLAGYDASLLGTG